MVNTESVAHCLSQELEYIGDDAIETAEQVDLNVILITLDNGGQFTLTVDEV